MSMDRRNLDIHYVAEEFRCPVCALYLASQRENEAASLDIDTWQRKSANAATNKYNNEWMIQRDRD
jgi:hypothetical protein